MTHPSEGWIPKALRLGYRNVVINRRSVCRPLAGSSRAARKTRNDSWAFHTEVNGAYYERSDETIEWMGRYCWECVACYRYSLGGRERHGYVEEEEEEPFMSFLY